MQPTRLEKLRAHTEHLLDLFIGLCEKYALLHPMIWETTTIESRGSAEREHGFSILKSVLSMSCVMDIAKIAADKDDRTPSISRLAQALQDPEVSLVLREEFAVWNIAPASGYAPEVLELIAKSEQKDERERREEFDGKLGEVRERWQRLGSSTRLQSFITMRDKFLAHAELHHVGNDYRPFDISALGIKWDDLKGTIDELRQLVILLTVLYRNASFAFDMLDEQLMRASGGFWA